MWFQEKRLVQDFKINNFPEKYVQDSCIGWAVIVAKYLNQWIFVKHKDRDTYEIPGGTRETNESVLECSKRELYEETGAIQYDITPLEIYSIRHSDSSVTYGQLFYANILKIIDLPDSEISEVQLFKHLPDELTYPYVHPVLFQRALEYSGIGDNIEMSGVC